MFDIRKDAIEILEIFKPSLRKIIWLVVVFIVTLFIGLFYGAIQLSVCQHASGGICGPYFAAVFYFPVLGMIFISTVWEFPSDLVMLFFQLLWSYFLVCVVFKFISMRRMKK